MCLGRGDNFDAEDLEWSFTKGSFEPRSMDSPPAPDTLLKVMRCKCKGGCDTKWFSCRKHGLHCSSVCGECKGVSCTNSSWIAINEDNEVDEMMPL